jgi:hypothetical protein
VRSGDGEKGEEKEEMGDDIWGSDISKRNRKQRDNWLLGCCGWASLMGLLGRGRSTSWAGGLKVKVGFVPS